MEIGPVRGLFCETPGIIIVSPPCPAGSWQSVLQAKRTSNRGRPLVLQHQPRPVLGQPRKIPLVKEHSFADISRLRTPPSTQLPLGDTTAAALEFATRGADGGRPRCGACTMDDGRRNQSWPRAYVSHLPRMKKASMSASGSTAVFPGTRCRWLRPITFVLRPPLAKRSISIAQDNTQ